MDYRLRGNEGGAVAQFVVRNIEAEVKSRLHRRAKRHHRSTEEEIRDILRNAVREKDATEGGMGSAIASLFTKIGLDAEIPEFRGREIKPPSFR
jgi:plasmid stability protein